MSSVLVDTCIWSLALRGKSPRDISASEELTRLIYSEKSGWPRRLEESFEDRSRLPSRRQQPGRDGRHR